MTRDVTPPMSGAERSRNYRARKKAREAARAGSGVQADGSWVPAFEGQRPPFRPGNPDAFREGNTASLVHGAGSPRRVVPLAQEIVERFVGEGYCPDYLRTMPQFLPAVEAWARLEARAHLLDEWLAGMSAEEMATARKAGSSAPVEIWLAAERAASRARERLGLDAASWAKLAKDLGIANRASEDAIARLGEAGRQIREKREAGLRVIGGGDP